MKSLRRNRYVIWLMASILLMGCHSNANDADGNDAGANGIGDNKTLTVGVLPTLDCVPFYVAEHLHLFEHEHADVVLKRYNAHMDCDQQLINNTLDGAVSDLVRAERLQSKGVALEYPISTNTYWLLIANRLARVNELKQLGDKMMAITRHSATDYLGNLAIDSAKPQNTVFRVQVNDVDIRLKMLQTNAMDAVWLTEPQATEAKRDKHPVLMDSRNKGLHLGVVAFRKDAVGTAHRDAQLKALLRAYNQACDSINTHGLTYYADIVKQECHIGDSVLSALPPVVYRHATPPSEHDVQVAKNVKWND